MSSLFSLNLKLNLKLNLNLNFILGILITLFFSSCTGIPARQTEALLQRPQEVPETSVISDVPFIEQSRNYCGPAGVAMVMNHAGHSVTMDELAPQMFTPGKKGTFQTDIISTVRRHGMLAISISGMSSLLKEIVAGHPVLILENLGLTWYPVWHYSVAVGYDLSQPAIILHSGPDKFFKKDLRKFERSWGLAGFWGLLILPPGELAETANDLEHVAAAAGLEQLGKLQEAEKSYQKVLARWPDSFGALIGMGNLTYSKRQYLQSIGYLESATQKYPQSAFAWHNLAMAQGAAGRVADARSSSRKALSLVDAENAPTFRRNLHQYQFKRDQ